MRLGVLLLILLILPQTGARAMMPDPAFRGLALVGFLCRVEPAGADAELLAQQVCRRAAVLASARLPQSLPSVALENFDPRITDPGTLLVTLHGNRIGGQLVLSIGLHRQGKPPGNLFPAAPQLVDLADGTALDKALLALIGQPVLAPFTPPPPGAMQAR